MVDLNVLKPSKTIRTSIETPDELMDLILDTYDDEPCELQQSLEYELAMLQQLIKIQALPKEYRNDCALLESLETDDVSVESIGKNIVKSLRTVKNSLKDFAEWVSTKIKDKTVSEKYIRSKFTRLQQAIKEADTSRAYVKQAPPFHWVQERLVGIHQICTYLKSQAANKKPITVETFRKVAEKSGGCCYSVSDQEGRMDLTWQEPPLADFEILKSDWGKPNNIDKIRELAVRAKYDALESLADTAKIMAKYCAELAQDHDEDPYSNNDPDYNSMAETYTSAYRCNKLIKDLNVIIRKEINTLLIKYVPRLINFKTI